MEITENNEENKVSYEEALFKLNKIVEKMERGDVPLNETVKYFEEGQKLLKFCKTELSSAEGKLLKLTENGNIEQLN